ncbi:MAG: AraC family transcriptional regulator [Eubacteriaceae bacterium]|nr:AraC family transcriptional regulator [Eubacteriaceae bacterium]
MIYSNSKSTIITSKMELIPEDEILREFPVACYDYDLIDRSEPWHWHEEFECAVLLSGEALLTIEGASHLLKKGDGYFINTNSMHSLYPHSKEKCRIHAIVFKPRVVSGWEGSVFERKYITPLRKAEGYYGSVLRDEEKEQREWLGGVDLIFYLFKDKPEGNENKIRGRLTEMLSVIISKKAAENTDKEKSINSMAPRIKPMLLYIWQNYSSRISLEDIAGAAFISKNECMDCFKKTLGISPIRYLNEYRIKTAAEMLITTENSITEIAESCGFYDNSYFTKFFRSIMHTTPLKYRKRAENRLD